MPNPVSDRKVLPRTAPHPQQAQMPQQLTKLLDDLRGGIEVAKRAVREQCQMGEGDDGQLRSIREPSS